MGVGLQDDASIQNAEHLLRRIPKYHIIPDARCGSRISSAAFDDHPSGSPMSVCLESVVWSSGREPRDVLAGHGGFSLAAITAGLARECGQAVLRDPLPDEPAHALVAGKKTRSVRRKMATGAEWVVPPEVSGGGR
jgi:hypothetical protein